jgi:hypothetical protein
MWIKQSITIKPSPFININLFKTFLFWFTVQENMLKRSEINVAAL